MNLLKLPTGVGEDPIIPVFYWDLLVFQEVTLSETNTSALKIGHPKKDRIVFQPFIFRCYASFREINSDF